MLEELAAARYRQQHQIVDREPGERREGVRTPLHALRAEARHAAERRICELAAADAPEEAGGLQQRAVAGAAGRVGAVARQQHPHVHLVGARLEPGKEAPGAVPDLARPGSLAFDHPAACLGGKLAPGGIERNPAKLRELLQVLLAFGVGLRLPGLDGTPAQRARLVGDHQPVVDADGAAEAAAGLARPQRRVERELARGRGAVGEIAVGAVQFTRVAPGVQRLGRVGIVDDLDVDASAPHAQRGLE